MSSDMPRGENLAVESAVMQRYSKGAKAEVPELCCPVNYDAKYLQVIPPEIITRDYGCGDPSQFAKEGDVVLDLGCGAGKVCYIASQIVGPRGRVIGVDFNTDMLALARKHQPEVAGRIGYDNVSFRRGRIQDLALDLDLVGEHFSRHQLGSVEDWMSFEDYADRLRAEKPLVATESIDIVLSNCVLNLVRNDDKRRLFQEIHRVLEPGGRAAVSDIVSDEVVPAAMRDDPDLWTGCISGAFQEQDFLQAFADAGFHGIELVKRGEEPWRVVEGIEFHSVTVLAHKGKEGPCFEHNQAVVYKGPFSAVHDDDGHTFVRGERAAVCDKTFKLLQRGPYLDRFYFVEPRVLVEPKDAKPFDCSRTTPRHPRETKGEVHDLTTEAPNCCGPDDAC